jgi:hypothetical protein
MTRASFTVRLKNGIGYDAALLMPTFEDHTMRPMLSFVCSGRMQSVPAADVKSVTFYAKNVNYCGVCEQPLNANVQQTT